MRGDVYLELARAARDAAEKFHGIAVEGAIDADAGLTVRDSLCVVDYLEITGFGLNFDRRRGAHASRRSDGERHAVVIDRQRADLGAVIELRVVPFPARAEQVAREETVVADQIAGDGFDSRGLDLIGQPLDGGDLVGGFEFVVTTRIV